MSFMNDFDHLQIQMKDIVTATNNFDPAKMIGRGGFGRVYRGELSLPEGQITVAFKQLDRRLGQGNIEFWKEIMMLSKYKHENLISLMHYCIEGDEMILVYEYASRGSLDRYLSDASTLTWIQRLRICVGAARGLQFLHDPMETQQRVLHRDIKSANILLDEKWTAKISDFGLSKISPANQEYTYVISNPVGTPGYGDPLYWELGFLSKESDVYSFGVVLFEILCGRLCCEYHNRKLHKILVPNWRRCYDEKRLDDIVLVGLKEQMHPGSFNSFSAIAYQCVKRAREERPTMAEVVKELEFSLEQQESVLWRPVFQQNSEILSRCIKENLGFMDGKPVAACVIYKCLLHWHAFVAERTAIFDFIIEKIHSVLNEGDEGVTLPYWLSNASTLLCLLQRKFRSTGFLTPISQRSGLSTLPIGRAAQSYTGQIYIGLEDGILHIPARYPEILFKQQLAACVEKIFGLLRDNLKKEISPLLASCIRASKNQGVHGGNSSRTPSAIPQQAGGSQWKKIVEFMDSLMDRLRGNHVPSVFIRKLTTQVFSFINISVFNSFLLRRECCTFSNGEYVKSGLAELEKWIANAKEEFAGQSWHELNYTRQAVGFLAIQQKNRKSLEEIRHDLCPALTIRQIYRISTMYWDDINGTRSVSNEVVAEMREVLNKESQNLTSNTFLLDDDLSIPFSSEDIYMTIPTIDPTDIEAPAFFSEYPPAQFLFQKP